MRKLLFSSLCFAFFACHTSEDSVKSNNSIDSTDVEFSDSMNLTKDSVRAIIHGSPEQEKLDSMKRAKGEKKGK